MADLSVVYWDHANNNILLINLAIAVGLFTSLRLFSGIIAHINASNELVKKDNPAFGISLAGVAFAVTIVLSGAIYGDPIYNVEDSVIAVGLYGILGIVLMAVTRLIFDKIALPDISMRDEIVRGNIAAGIMDAGNVIATAIVIRAVMTWADTSTVDGIQAVIIGYAVSQVLLTLESYVIRKAHSHRHKSPLQTMISKENTALALKLAGRKIGTAFAISAASSIMVYEVYETQMLLAAWAGVSLIIMVVVGILAFIANRAILFGLHPEEEVIEQKNVAMGVVQGVIYISIGLLVAQLMA